MEKKNNNKEIQAAALRGYCTLATCWQFIHDVSSSLEALHACGKGHGNIGLKQIIVKGQHFELNPGETSQAESSDIWNLAASAMELILGSPIFNGKGEEEVSNKAPIPSLTDPEASTLNALLHRCLSPIKEKRPTATLIKETAMEELKKNSGKQREPRLHRNVAQEATMAEIDRKWPDKMIAAGLKTIMLLLFMFAVHAPLHAQTIEGEDELNDLCKAAILLRNNDKDSFEKAQDVLEKYINTFTLMDKLNDKTNDCKPIGRLVERLGINTIIGELKQGRRVQNSGTELLNGSDSRFSYFIIEKCIKKKATATYRITKRSGKQVFVIIPYSSNSKYSCSLQIGEDDSIISLSKAGNGISYCIIDKDNGPENGEDITLRIGNENNDNASFVIMNHNYGKE